MAAATFISLIPVNKQQIAYSKQNKPLIKPNRRRRSGSSTLCPALSSSSSSKTKQSQVSRRIEEEEMDDVEKLLESEMESMRLQQSTDQDELDEEGGRELDAEDETAGKADDWREVINKVVPAVVVLQITATRAFDTALPGSYSATGFIVDKKRGIILTNRHVVTPGPVVAQATFVNHEEIPIHPLYRDPVHDFGFFRYDPGAIRFLDYEEIPLAPEAACVGLEIRVVGNDSCEKVSISAGTLARLDRNAPTYRKDGYNDFNTFYIQAASGTKGGSSGSPVIDRKGRVVALNAGGKTSSSSAFFLPLERIRQVYMKSLSGSQVVRALQILQKGRDSCTNKWEAVAIPRGTLQVTFSHKGFDEARRLGLQNETEQMVRTASSTSGTGMLVVDSVVPGGPADSHLEPGDVLVCVNGKITTNFLDLETLLDNSVNQKIVLQIERGGRPLNVVLEVQDLHSITPDHFLELSGAVIHPLSYQQARNFRFHCGLVYVSDPGYMLFRAGVPRHAIIKKFGDAEISLLEELTLALSKLSMGARVPIEYITSNDRYRRKSVLVMIDQHEWYDTPKTYTRDDSSGLWTISPAFQPEPLQLLSCSSDIIQDTQISASSCKSTILGHMHQDGNQGQKMTKGANSSGSPSQHFDEETHAKEENDVKETKKEVEGEFSADGVVIANTSQGNEENQSEVPSVNSNSISSDNKIAGASNNASSVEHIIEPSLVMLEVNVPPSCLLDGVRSQVFAGSGVVIQHSEGMGLVAVDRNTVPIFACDVMLSFASFPIEIPGQVVFLHPVYNYALVAYDPSALGRVGASTIRAAELLPEPALNSGDQVYLVGLSRSLRAMSRKSTVTNSCTTINAGSTDPPRYRPTNMEVVELDSDFGYTITGVLSNEHGKVQALWGSFSNKMKSCGPSKDQQFVKGIPIYMISQVLDKIISGANGPSLLINGVKRPMPLVRILEVELCRRLLSRARSFGLGEDWIQALVKKDPVRRQVLRVKGCFAGSKAEGLLKEGDMLLAVNKEPVTCFRDLENACQTLEKCGDNDGKLNITIFRQGCQVDLLVGTDLRDGIGTTRVVNWCGCIIQHPNAAVRALGFLPEKGHGVYVGKLYRGSPADRYGLHALRWIVEVNGKPTPHLDAFLDVTKELGYEEFVRVRTINLSGKPKVLTLKQDLHYWPTWELRFDPDTAKWRRQTIKALNLSDE